MNDTIKIGLPMEYEDDKNITRTGLWLKEYEVEALEKRLNKCNQVQSNWNSLREWLLKDTKDTFFEVVRIKDILDKMNELEGKNRE